MGGGSPASTHGSATSDVSSLRSGQGQHTSESAGMHAQPGGVHAVSLASLGGGSRSSSAPRGDAVTPVDELHVTVGNLPSSLQAVEHTMSDRELSSIARQTGALAGLVASARELPAAALDNLDSLASRITRSASVDKPSNEQQRRSARGARPTQQQQQQQQQPRPPPLRSVQSAGSLDTLEGGLGIGGGGAQYRQRSHTGTLSPLSIAQSPSLNGGEGGVPPDGELPAALLQSTPPKPAAGGSTHGASPLSPPAVAVASMAASLAEDTTVAAILGALNSPVKRGARKEMTPPVSPPQTASTDAFGKPAAAPKGNADQGAQQQQPPPPDAGEGGAGGFEYGPASNWAWSAKDTPPTQEEQANSPPPQVAPDSQARQRGGPTAGAGLLAAPPPSRASQGGSMPQHRTAPAFPTDTAQQSKPHDGSVSSSAPVSRGGAGAVASGKFARLVISSNPPAQAGKPWAPPVSTQQYGAPPSSNLGGTRTLQRSIGPDGGGVFFTSAPPAPLPLPDGETVAQLLAESKSATHGFGGRGVSTVPSAGMSVDALTPPIGRGGGAPGVSSQAPIAAASTTWSTTSPTAYMNGAGSHGPATAPPSSSGLPPWLLAAQGAHAPPSK